MARDYRSEYDNYQKKRIKYRTELNKARREAEEKGVVRKGDGKDLNHVKPYSKGGSTTPSNLRAVPKSQNRSFARNPDGSMKR
jgi:hypothetical protein